MTFNEPSSIVKTKNDSTPANAQNNAEKTDNEQNIWSHILQEVQNSTKKTPPAKSLILLGDNESGRSTLISRLKGVDSITKGIGLEYHYIEIKDEDRDDTPKLSVWVPDGDGACTGLLKFALNETNFENTLVAFVVSMSTPWTIMESLKKWSNILREHIQKLNLTDAKREEYMKQQCRLFQMYQDPDESNQSFNSSKKGAGSSNQTDLDSKKTEQKFDDDSLLPLDPSILSKNLGVSIIVIVTKSDSISILDKENEYRIEHFDFIQYHVRKFCLDFGAALFYTTVKDKRTYDRLYKYLLHRLYNYQFNIPSSVVDRESIFIPSGWDNEGKINILLENSTTIKSDSEYSDIISKPSIRKPLYRDVETVYAIEDQEFLSRLQIVLNKATTPATKTDDANPSSNSSSNTPTSIKTPVKPTPTLLKGSNPNAPDSTNLKNFFQNLLNKNAPSTSSSSAPSAAAAAAAASSTPTLAQMSQNLTADQSNSSNSESNA